MLLELAVGLDLACLRGPSGPLAASSFAPDGGERRGLLRVAALSCLSVVPPTVAAAAALPAEAPMVEGAAVAAVFTETEAAAAVAALAFWAANSLAFSTAARRGERLPLDSAKWMLERKQSKSLQARTNTGLL